MCVLHPTMGAIIAEDMQRSFPGIVVDVSHDVDRDPPGIEELDVLVANTLPDGILERCPVLKWLHLTGSGLDHLAAAGHKEGLVISNSADVPAVAVAEFVWMALLALAKDGPQLVRQQTSRTWRLPYTRLVDGSHLVLVGLGRIGLEIAQRASAFGVRVTAVRRHPRPSPLAERVVGPAELAAVVPTADHLVVAVPATEETRRLVDQRVIAALPPDAVVVNVSRSAVIDTDALVDALASRRIRGAVLDVHDAEPLPTTSPLWAVPRLWVTPHAAYRFPGEERAIARLVTCNLSALLAGREIHNNVGAAAGHREYSARSTGNEP